MDSGKLADMVELLQDKKHQIHSITVIRNGYVVLDAYQYPFRKNAQHLLYSVTKSITSALVGIAVDKGYLQSLQQPVISFFPEKSIANLDERKQSLTVEHLLTMSAGLDSQDSYLYQWAGLARMMSSEDWVQYVLDLPMVDAPGNRFEYSNAASFLLAAIIHRATGMAPLEFARKYLFDPLGIKDVQWPTGPDGINTGWSRMMLNPHDMAKFGLLFLNKGQWAGEQIISREWVESSTRKQLPATLFDGYGYQWWTDSDGYYMAMGYLGQHIFVVPDKNLVAVFTANLESFDDFYLPQDLLDRFIIPAVLETNEWSGKPQENQRLARSLDTFADAPSEGWTWGLGQKGIAREGEYQHIESPGFRFFYPLTSLRQETMFPNQVMRMKTPRGNFFAASVAKIPAGVELVEVGPRVFAGSLEVVSNAMFSLKDGTPASRTVVNWEWDGFQMRTLLVSAYVGEKWIYLTYTFEVPHESMIMEDLREGMATVQSLVFN